ncbi:MAG: serine/threonine protein kinase, partial [Deltaproteobacteria bacterium]
MATVYLGRLNAAGGVGRIVAVKRLHAQFAKNPDFVRMFLDEARLATRIHHPNVVPTLDVVADEGELFVVMDYIRGESLSKLLRAVTASGDGIPIPIVSSIISGVLQGLDAAHEATDEQGQPLGIVHRDVSPQNILVGEDGMARILDFGVAKAASRLHETQDGQLKGKLAYMAPEQIDGAVTKLCDLYAAG